MAELKEQIQQIEQQIETVSELFYQQKNAEGYSQLESIIVNVAKVVETVYTANPDDAAVMEKINKLTSVLQETMESMEDKDTILLADMLKYELPEVLQSLL
ncbi:MAG: hypothetical protein J1E62_04790 [Lachnospiraceae bacterium]|nr:hypothetical protein [Lachnospiraceae bacterium]